MRSLQQDFSVPYRYQVYFTADLFSIDNPILRDLAGHSLRALTRGVLRPGRTPVGEAKTVAPGE